MVVRPDSNPPTAPAAGNHQPLSDLTLNEPFGGASSVPLEQPNRVPSSALTRAARTSDAGRSWLWRLRSLKGSRQETHLRRSADDELVTTDAISDEKHLAALTTLRDVCARIDQRLARAEAASGRADGVTSEEALHDLCTQIFDRLSRVETAIQRTEGFVSDKPWDVSTIAYKRLERAEETLRLTQQSLADTTLPEMCVNIERQLIQTRKALQRTEEVVADKTLRDLCQNIDARLGRTEDTLRRTEGIVAERLQVLSASMTARLAEAENTIQRLERIVSTRTAEPPLPQQTSASITPMTPAAQWNYRFAVPALVLVVVMTVVIGALFKTSRTAATEKAVSVAAIEQTPAPSSVAAATTERVATASAESGVTQIPTPSPSALATNASRSTAEGRDFAPKAQSPNRESSASIATPPRSFVGRLSIKSVPPGASVTINGKAAGVTPLTLPRQRAGSLAVQIAQDGFERWSAAVRVPADQLTEVSARLRPVVP
jgi:ElaB/YqjD/DUF883 family membrane-anchored ribosome-binding protein